jgi:DNA-binding NarL/FixJ family response regulator
MNIISSRSVNFNRVLIVDNQGLMGAGMEKLLSEEPSLEVFGITTESETALVQNISRLQPDIIILILESQETTPIRLLELLLDYGRLRIIRVSLNSNMFEVYEKQQMITNSWVTLLSQVKIKHAAAEKCFLP